MSHAVRSMTSLPARIMEWNDRGWIKEGFRADIAVIDLAKLETPATISNPQQYSKGVDALVINGVVAIEKGAYNGKLPGKVLTLKGAAAKPIAPLALRQDDGPAGDRPAAADEAQALVRLGLQPEPVPGQSQDGAEDVLHRLEVRPELGLLRDDDGVGVDEAHASSLRAAS